MSSFKKLKRSDVFTIPYVAHKNWSFTYATLPVSGSIVIYEGDKPTGSFNFKTDVTTSLGQFETLVYTQINHLFYQQYSESLSTQSLMLSTTNYTSASSQRPTSSYFIYNENPSYTENFPIITGSRVQVISVSKELYGERILPGTFQASSSVNNFYDDGNGNLMRFGVPVGNVFYSHGIAVITDPAYQFWWFPLTVKFQNELTVYENYITCTAKESEFNLTYNPSLQQNLTGSVQDFATGSVFVPYVTTIGLYNDNNELLMVAKIAQPIPLSSETDTSFLLRYDT